MKNRLVLETLKYLQGLGIKRSLVELHLTRFFTTAELDDGSVGACMSYYHNLPDNVLVELENPLQDACSDPFMVQDSANLRRIIAESVSDEQQGDYVEASLIATLTSALSTPLIRAGGDEYFFVQNHRPGNWLDGGQSALVVGFGGFLRSLVDEDSIKKLHVVDLLYERKKDEYLTQVATWSSWHPSKSITVSAQLEGAAHLREFDLLFITGSTLCNGTLEYFLSNVRPDAIVVLQGQSAGMHPKVLFEAGVEWIATTLKPNELGRMAHGGQEGEEMRSLLQGGLPWIYLLPRSQEPIN